MVTPAGRFYGDPVALIFLSPLSGKPPQALRRQKSAQKDPRRLSVSGARLFEIIAQLIRITSCQRLQPVQQQDELSVL